MIIYAIKILPLIKDEVFYDMMNIVSIDKQNRIRKFFNYKDRIRSLLGDILVRYGLCKSYGFKNSEINFKVNEYGKPFIEDSNIEFNISHSGQWVVAVLNDSAVGIDVEEITPIDFTIAKRFFSYDENKVLDDLEGLEKRDKFFDYWAIKESYVKMVGRGLTINMHSFTVCIENYDKIFIKQNNLVLPLSVKLINICRNYKLSVCTKGNDIVNDIRMLSMDKLLEEMYMIA